jgi:hypothetical protein
LCGPYASRWTANTAGNFQPNLESTMSRTPNDDRSDSMNPNNDAYHHAQDNYGDQLNPNNERYQGEQNSEED